MSAAAIYCGSLILRAPFDIWLFFTTVKERLLEKFLLNMVHFLSDEGKARVSLTGNSLLALRFVLETE
jgi:hypothetical protein